MSSSIDRSRQAKKPFPKFGQIAKAKIRAASLTAASLTATRAEEANSRFDLRAGFRKSTVIVCMTMDLVCGRLLLQWERMALRRWLSHVAKRHCRYGRLRLFARIRETDRAAEATREFSRNKSELQALWAVAALFGSVLLSGVCLERFAGQGGFAYEHVPPAKVPFQIDINAATTRELQLLPGIGPKLAQRLIDSRNTTGPYADNHDLTRVSGIGPRTVQRMAPYLKWSADDTWQPKADVDSKTEVTFVDEHHP